MIGRLEFLRASGALIVAIEANPLAAFAQSASPPPPPASAGGKAETATAGLPSYPNLESWIAIDRDGSAITTWGKVELGTGIRTAIGQLVADELDLPFDRVHVVDIATTDSPNQGYTAGSQSLTSGATPVRAAAAAARAELVARASAHFQVPAERLTTRDGAVVSMAGDLHIAYADLVRAGSLRGAIGTPRMKPPSEFHSIGSDVPRVDIPAKLTGAASYIQDKHVPGMLHGRVVRSEMPNAAIASVNDRGLHAIPGARVVRVGNFVGVVAPREWDAIRAQHALEVRWTQTTTLPEPNELFAAVRAVPSTKVTVANKGDAAAELAASHPISATYQWPYQSHASIGPSCAIADVTPTAATIYASTQGVFALRGAIAELLGRTPETVHVQYVEGSGCYGQNGADDVAADAALLSRAVRAPVRVQWMRADETAHDPKGPAMIMDVRGSVADGRVRAWSFDSYSPTHSMRPDGFAVRLLAGMETGAASHPITFIGGDRDALTTYTFAHQSVTMHNASTALIRHSAMRGLGAPQNTFANESFLDELAHAANAHPIDFRLAHLDDPRSTAVLEAVRSAYAPQHGVAFVRYESKNTYVAAVADVSVDRKTGVVRVNKLTIAHDCGLIVNPNGLRNQIEGNAIQGTSRALKEAVRFDRSHIRSVDWKSYPILRFSEVPDVEITLIDRRDQPILGAGEATTAVIAPAIANAVFAQSGIRLRTVPFTPENVLAAARA